MESLDYLQDAAVSDPVSLGVSTRLQLVLYTVGQLGEAEREYARSADLQGDRIFVESYALMRAVLEDFDTSAINDRIARYEAEVPEELRLFSSVLASLNEPVVAIEDLRSALNNPGPGAASPLLIAWWADYFGETDLALESMRRYFEQTSRADSSIWTPFFRNSRAAPGFRELVRNYGLVAYWRETGNWGDFCRPLDDTEFECF